MAKFSSINQAKKYYKGWYIVWYQFRNVQHGLDRKYWIAEKNGVVEDYHLKESLIYEGLKNKEKVVVLCWHRNGQVSSKEILHKATNNS